MPWKLDKLTDQSVRHAMGRRFEILTDEVFNVVRWSVLVGFSQFLARKFPAPVFELIYYVLAAFLFGYLASRFLLRPEIPLVPNPEKRWQRLLQSALNFLICVGAFLVVVVGINMVEDAVALHQIEQTAPQSG